jgi:hypothetical protein
MTWPRRLPALVLGAALCAAALSAARTAAAAGEPESLQATSSAAARQSAIHSIPLDKLDADGRAKVNAVLNNVTVFRRFPVRVVNCDPDLYLFVIRHPDVVVNIWQVLGLSQLQFRQTGPDTYHVVESAGTTSTLEFLYHTHDTHVIYGRWAYTGPLLARTVHGQCLAVLKTGYVRETDGRYYVTSRLDGFLSVEPGGVELLTKALHSLVIKNADTNFVQTVAFVGSLSRTAEVNLRGMQHLAQRLTDVQPDVRRQFAQVVTGVAQRAAALQAAESQAKPAQVASQSGTEGAR